MRNIFISAVAIPFLLVPISVAQKATTADSAALISRGKYPVEGVGMCGDCHTPRNEKGEPMKEQWLKGAALDFRPAVPIPVWADKSVDIAGLRGWDRDAAINYDRGRPNSVPARAPMPQYRFNLQDATAIVTYLKSLAAVK
jgi:mono/diheme cytochrome c family protein